MSKMKALVCASAEKNIRPRRFTSARCGFGPLEVKYNYEEIKKRFRARRSRDGPHSMWRYLDLLPVEGTNFVGPHAGVYAVGAGQESRRLSRLDELYIKNDTVNHPTLSFKDRVVAVALTRARELGFETVACASTGNLANSVSATPHRPISIATCSSRRPRSRQGARQSDLQAPRRRSGGNYDTTHRLCSELPVSMAGPS